MNLVLAAIGVGVSVYFGRYSARQMAERRRLTLLRLNPWVAAREAAVVPLR